MTNENEKKMPQSSSAKKAVGFAGMFFVAAMVLAAVFVPFQNVDSMTQTGTTEQLQLQAQDSDDEEDSDEDKMRTLTVSGTHEISMAPEKVDLYFSVETDSLKAKDSQAKNAENSAKVIAALKAAGISQDDIETVSYSLYELNEYDYTLNKNVKKGFRTTNSFKVSLTTINDAGKIIDAITSAGANRVDSIVFGLNDDTVKELKLLALEMAAADSLVKAKAMAKGVDVQVKQLESMSENSAYYYPQYARSYDLAAGASPAPESASTEFFAGDIKVSANVTATYSIE